MRLTALVRKKQLLQGFYIGLGFFLFSCSSATSDLTIDGETWKSDLDGCSGKRQGMRKQIEENRLKLLGLKEHNIRSLFGKPDAEELLVRSQKIYIYYLTPGPKCATAATAGTTALTIRLDALGNVREASLHDD